MKSVLRHFLICTVLLAFSGCASRTTVTTREYDDPRARIEYSTAPTETHTTTVVASDDIDDDDDADRGFFGIVGNIIALPFRAVGGLFDAIF